MRFAGLMPEQEDRFAGIDWTTAVTGCPILPGGLGWLDCRLVYAYDGGDHTIYVGQVEAAHTRDGDPLLYFSRQWRQLDPAPL
jgi:flavin reductase (DIM6/NTAB) family NADH-FMN oxidoreductase RutF